MTREHKLALVVGFSLVLVVGVLISDHFSKAHAIKMAQANVQEPVIMHEYTLQAPPPPATLPVDRTAERTLTPPAVPDANLAATNPEPRILDMSSTEKPKIASAAGAEGDGARFGVHGLDALVRAEPVPVIEGPKNQSETLKPAPNSGFSNGPISKGTLQRHEVVKGDTIGRIADRYYGDRNLWKQLQAYNKNRVSSDGVMRMGVTLLIPPKDVLLGQAALPPDAKIGVPAVSPTPTKDAPKTADKSADKAAAEKALADKADKSGKSGTIYTVQSGDTLASIALKSLGNKARWEQIRDLNTDTLDDEDTLTVGQKIKLPPK